MPIDPRWIDGKPHSDFGGGEQLTIIDGDRFGRGRWGRGHQTNQNGGPYPIKLRQKLNELLTGHRLYR